MNSITDNVCTSSDGRWWIVRRSDGTHAVHDMYRVFTLVGSRPSMELACALVQEVRT